MQKYDSRRKWEEREWGKDVDRKRVGDRENGKDEGVGQEERIGTGGWRKTGEVINRREEEKLQFTFNWNRYNRTQFCLFRLITLGEIWNT